MPMKELSFEKKSFLFSLPKSHGSVQKQTIKAAGHYSSAAKYISFKEYFQSKINL